MNLKKVLHIIYGIFVVGFVLVLLGAVLGSLLGTVLGFLVMIAGSVFNYIKWRCPHCGEHLGRDTPKYCPHCGHRLQDLE